MERAREAGLIIFDEIGNGPEDVLIKYAKGASLYKYEDGRHVIYWDFRSGLRCGNSNCGGSSGLQSPATALAHEVEHAYDYIFNYEQVPKGRGGGIDLSKWEQSISQRAQRTIAEKYGEAYRIRYSVATGAVGKNKSSVGAFTASCVTCLN